MKCALKQDANNAYIVNIKNPSLQKKSGRLFTQIHTKSNFYSEFKLQI